MMPEPLDVTMQQQPRNDRSDELSEVLKEWRVDASLPPRFRESVWRNIAVSEGSHNARNGFWSSLLLHWENFVRRPVGIAACLALFTAVGVGFGLWHARAFAHRAETAWQNAYVLSVNPTSVAVPP